MYLWYGRQLNIKHTNYIVVTNDRIKTFRTHQHFYVKTCGFFILFININLFYYNLLTFPI